MFGRILQPGSRQRPFVIAAIILVGIILVGLLAIGAISLFRKSAGEASPTPTTPIVTPTKSATAFAWTTMSIESSRAFSASLWRDRSAGSSTRAR